MEIYTQGSAVKLSATFVNGAGAAADPASVVLSIIKPDESATELAYGTDAALQKDSTGNYHADVIADQPGRWLYRWDGSGGIIAAGEGFYDVADSQFD